jgi:hypothetical protein
VPLGAKAEALVFTRIRQRGARWVALLLSLRELK